MVTVPVVLLVIVGLLFVLPPLLRLRIARLRVASLIVQLSRPLDFGKPLAGLASLAVSAACLLAAGSMAGLLPERAGPTPAPPAVSRISESGTLMAPQPTMTPLRPEEFDFVEVEDSGAVAFRLLQPDTMAGWTASAQSGDFDLEVLADSIQGPINSVVCVAFRADGAEIRPGETYRASGTGDWPRTGYMYCVSHVGLWALSRFDNGRPAYLREFQESKAIRQIKANKLRVRAEGSTIQLWLNDLEMAHVTDPSYTSGKIQLTCGTPMDEVPAGQCRFEGLKITPLP